MTLWLIQSNDRTLAVVKAGGRRKALTTWRGASGRDTTLHYSGREPYLLPVAGGADRPADPESAGAIKAAEALVVDGEVRLRAEVLAERGPR